MWCAFQTLRHCSYQECKHSGSRKKKEFCQLIDTLCNEDTDLFGFERACKTMARKFPNACEWLVWHIHPKRARHYFPACTGFTEEEHSRFIRLASSTNAQENVGRQFQHLYECPMAVNETILCTYKFAKSFESDRKAVLIARKTRDLKQETKAGVFGRRF